MWDAVLEYRVWCHPERGAPDEVASRLNVVDVYASARLTIRRMNDSVDSSASGVRVASAITGRIRLRAVGATGRESLASVADAVGDLPQITAAQLRPQSGSLVVNFDPEHASAVADGLRALGVDPITDQPRAAPVDPTVAVGNAAARANRAVGRRLDGWDLRSLVSLGLGLLAARSAMRRDDRLADAPWYVLAWYASETFMKAHGRTAR